jgi:hypothetical protein
MKNTMLLMQQVLLECGTKCGTSTDLDWKTIERRFEHEGTSFLTITLPDFCSTFEKALETRQTSRLDWPGWVTRGNTPVFLGKFFDYVFDRDTGRLLEDVALEEYILQWYPSDGPWHILPKGKNRQDAILDFRREWWESNESCLLNAVASIRQVTRLFSKIEIECSQERIDAAYKAFLECEHELRHVKFPEDRSSATSDTVFDHLESPFYQDGKPKLNALTRIGNLLYGDIYTEMCKDLLEGHPMPKHGPGSTADRLVGNKKFEQVEWPVRLDRSFPAGEYLLPSWRYK